MSVTRLHSREGQKPPSNQKRRLLTLPKKKIGEGGRARAQKSLLIPKKKGGPLPPSNKQTQGRPFINMDEGMDFGPVVHSRGGFYPLDR